MKNLVVFFSLALVFFGAKAGDWKGFLTETKYAHRDFYGIAVKAEAWPAFEAQQRANLGQNWDSLLVGKLPTRKETLNFDGLNTWAFSLSKKTAEHIPPRHTLDGYCYSPTRNVGSETFLVATLLNGEDWIIASYGCGNPCLNKLSDVAGQPARQVQPAAPATVSVASPTGGGDINIHIDIDNSNSGGSQAQPASDPIYPSYQYAGQQWPVIGSYQGYQIVMIQDYQCCLYNGYPYTMIGGRWCQPVCDYRGWGWQALGAFAGAFLGSFFNGGNGYCGNGNNGGVVINNNNINNFYNTYHNTYNYSGGGTGTGNNSGYGPASNGGNQNGNNSGYGPASNGGNQNGNNSGYGPASGTRKGAIVGNGTNVSQPQTPAYPKGSYASPKDQIRGQYGNPKVTYSQPATRPTYDSRPTSASTYGRPQTPAYPKGSYASPKDQIRGQYGNPKVTYSQPASRPTFQGGGKPQIVQHQQAQPRPMMRR